LKVSIDPQWRALGWSVAGAGDVNGDGFDDVIVGNPGFTDNLTSQGRALLFLGTSSGISPSPAWSAMGDQERAEFGFSVGGAGDVNGDGYDDLIVGSPGYDSFEEDTGAAYVFFGSRAGPVGGWSAHGLGCNSRYGRSVASAGDVNNDGYDDVVIGAPSTILGACTHPVAAAVDVVLGSPSGPSVHRRITGRPEAFGWSVASAGDVDADGFDDVVVGSYIEARAYVYLGSPQDIVLGWTSPPAQANSYYGFSVAGAGDVNGDGFGDFMVGAIEHDEDQQGEGKVFLYTGSQEGPSSDVAWTATGDQIGANFGFSVAGAGDIDGDGFDDIVIGSTGFAGPLPYEGRALMYLGSADGPATVPAWSAEGDQENSLFGWSVAGAGDLNGDGVGDVIVGAPRFQNGADLYPGRVDIYFFAATCVDTDGDGYGAPGNSLCPAGSARDCDDADASIHPGAADLCDGLDNDCDGTVDAPVAAACAASPATMNLRSEGGGFSVEARLSSACSEAPLDPTRLDPLHVSRVSAPSFGTIVLQEPSTAPGCDDRTEDGIWENVSARKASRDGSMEIVFNRPSDGLCSTPDGNRQDIIALLLDAVDGETVEVCVAGSYPGDPSVECCAPVRVTVRGSR
jgi:hypothetical protein